MRTPDDQVTHRRSGGSDGHLIVLAPPAHAADVAGTGWQCSGMGGVQFSGDAELAERVRALRTAGATCAQIKAELHVGASTISRLLGVYGKGRARPRVPTAHENAPGRYAGTAGRRPGSPVAGLVKRTTWQLTKGIAWTPGSDGASRRAEAGRVNWRRERARRAVERERREVSAP
ncbi:hypothetical protein [Haloactinopolyspora alba]|uniref:hypothetical protein n=1 Tax=Haloactinopolyspora alba TaxID=648780 RepID=UPI00101BE437|nr:hypothetical protein [Haloactinopolyspora alba]